MRYSADSAPEEKDWIVNPGSPLTRRLYDQSRISEKSLADKPSWEEAKPKIVSFFANLDVLFVYDRENQKQWFAKHILGAKSTRPVLVDLFEMAQFFLPDQDIPGDETLIQRFVPETEWRTNDPRLPLLVRSLSGALPAGGVLKNILDQIRAESQAHSGKHLVYTLLHRALGKEKAAAFQDFYALFRVAGMAHQIRWNKDSLFAEPYGDTTPREIQDADFPKDAEVEGDARKQKNWVTRQWTTLLSEEATRGLESVPTRERIDPKNPPRTARPVVNTKRVDDFFDWLIKKEHFQPRQEQQDFARFCVGAINKGGTYAIEAGTGTGKTLGYLIPACEGIRQRQGMAETGSETAEDAEVGKVIIATATKNLQDHLLDKEWPRLAQTGSLYQDVKAATLKGKGNFLCITAVVDLFAEHYRPKDEPTLIENISLEERIQKRLAWLFLFLTVIRNRGETENISWPSFRSRFPDLKDFLDETKADVACTGDLCRMGTGCIYPRHLQKAHEADIVVTNHYKLPLMDSQIQALGHTCLIDEADQFPDNLRSAAAVRLSRYDIHRLFLQRIQGSEKRRGFAKMLQDRFTKQLKRKGAKKPDQDTQKDLEGAIKDISRILVYCEAVEYCSNTIENILKNSIAFKKNYNSDEKRWGDVGPVAIQHIQENLGSLAEHCKKIAGCWDNLSNLKIYEKSENMQQAQEKKRILKYRKYAKELAEKSQSIKNDYPSSEYVHICSFEYGKYRYAKWTLEKIPYDISKITQKTCCDPYATTVFTSATLFVDDSLDLFSTELGAPFGEDAQKRIASPFRYSENVRGFVTTSIPAYDYRAPRETKIRWERQIAGAIARLTVAMNGRTLVLFTSTADMKDIFRQVRPILEQHGIEPLLQDGSSLAEINAFRATEQSVLFGVDRFWTGVDFPDRTLSQVIVVRLPNPSLGKPIIKHRLAIMGRDFWNEYYHPASKLKLRQGFGRLIRKETDKGVFVALDQRIWSSEHMRDLQKALPIPLHQHSTEPDEMDWFINEGLAHLGLKSEFQGRNIDLRTITLPGETYPASRKTNRKPNRKT